MNLQKLLAETPPEAIDRFMDLARQSYEVVDIKLLERMIDEGLTPWQASVRIAEEIYRSPHSLYVRARTLAKEVHEHFGGSAPDWAARLIEKGEITGVPPYLAHEIRKLVIHEGFRVDTLITLRLRKRR